METQRSGIKQRNGEISSQATLKMLFPVYNRTLILFIISAVDEKLHRMQRLCEKRWESFSNCTLEQLEAGGNISHLHPLNFSLHKFHSPTKATRIASASNIICRKKVELINFYEKGKEMS